MKGCKYCGSERHFPFQCWKNPKRIKGFSVPKPLHCTYCDRIGHLKVNCFEHKPKIPSYLIDPETKRYPPVLRAAKLKSYGKWAKRWAKTRSQWFIENPADNYTCYLCGKYLNPEETTLDHVIPRSRAPELRYVMSNLRPCCMTCNSIKGSKVL